MSQNNQLTLTPAQQNGITIITELQKDFNTYLNPQQKERFLTIAKERLRAQPELLQARPQTVFNAIKELALSGIEPTVQHAVLVIRENKQPDGSKLKECVLQITAEGKKRAINVVTNGEMYVVADVIRANDTYKAGGFPRRLQEHEYQFTDRGDIIGAYAVLMRTVDDSQVQLVEMTKDEIEHIRDTYSETQFNKKWDNAGKEYVKDPKTELQKADTVWFKEFSEMCIKTVISRLHKRIKANINSYTKPKSEIVINKADSQTEVTLDFLDALENPNIVNNPDQPIEIDIHSDSAEAQIDLQEDGALIGEEKLTTTI